MKKNLLLAAIAFVFMGVAYGMENREASESANINDSASSATTTNSEAVVPQNQDLLAEVQSMRNRLDELLRQASNNSGVSTTPDILQEAAQSSISIESYDLLSESQASVEICRNEYSQQANERLVREMRNLKNEVQEGQRTWEDALLLMKDNVETLIQNLDEKYAQLFRAFDHAWQERLNHQAENFEHQKQLLQKEKDEAVKQYQELYRTTQLKAEVDRVFLANPSLKPEKIRVRAVDIIRMDNIDGQKRAIENEYNKFSCFTAVFGRDDLGVVATTEDMSNVADAIKLRSIQKPKLELAAKTPLPAGVLSYENEKGMGYLLQDIHKYIPEAHPNPWKLKSEGWLSKLDKRIAEINVQKKKDHQKQLVEYGKAVEQIKVTPFPTESFDRLVDQFNVFVSIL